MKKLNLLITLIVAIIFASGNLNAQYLTVESVNEYNYPQHRDNIGTYAYGDTLKVKGTYVTDSAETSISLQLLTFNKDPWENVDGYSFTLPAPLNGIIDTFLIVPDAYTLGQSAYTQMLQIRGSFGTESEFLNLYLSVIEAHPVRQTLIDFDEQFGPCSGSTLVNNIGSALSVMEAGDTLLFKGSDYDFEGLSLTINKAICLTGAWPTNIDKNTIGAYDVNSTFRNLKSYNLTSSNIAMRNIRIIPIAEYNYVFGRVSNSTMGMYYTGITYENVILEDGNVQVYGENGAGIAFRNVSFLNFEHSGYACNRKQPIDELPRSEFKLCKFEPNWDKVFYNTRGVSMDAGNDNHPVVWNMNEMLIDSCLFDGTGCGWSKGENASVTNCHFIGYRGDVDMIHMEEYTNNILIENNLFEYNKASRTFYLDRSLQPSYDITIINNTFKGQYKWIFWGESPQNLRFENNDLTEASAADPNTATFDFRAHQTADYEAAPYDLPIENLIIRNNSGIDKTEIGIMSIHWLSGDETNIIEDYPASKIQKNVVDNRPLPLLGTTAIYRISLGNNNEAISANDASDNVALSNDELTLSDELWEVKFRYPYNYTFRNLKSGNYMETFKIYTLGDYDNENPARYAIEEKSDWDGKTALPHWFLSEIDGRGSGLFQIYPGTNEKKSRLIKDGTEVILDFAQDKENKQFFPANENSTWKFEKMEGITIGENDFFGVHTEEVIDTTLASEYTNRYTYKDEYWNGDTLFSDSITVDTTYFVYEVKETIVTDSVYLNETRRSEKIITSPLLDTTFAVVDTVSWYTIKTGIGSSNLEGNLNIFPNPASGQVYIECQTASQGDLNISILDTSGRLRMTERVNTNKHRSICIETLKRGFYVILLDDGREQIQRKLIVK